MHVHIMGLRVMCPCTNEEARGRCWAYCSLFSPYSFKTGSFTETEGHHFSWGVWTLSWDLCVSALQPCCSRHVLSMMMSFMGAEDLNSGLPACTGSALTH